MNGAPVQKRSDGPFAGYMRDSGLRFGRYATITVVYLTGAVAVVAAAERRGVTVPARELPVLALAGHKAARLVAKHKVTAIVRAPFTRFEGSIEAGEVMETPRGQGLRKAVGELLACPFCISMWTSSALVAARMLFPHASRFATSTLVVMAGSDYLQYAWTAVQAGTRKLD